MWMSKQHLMSHSGGLDWKERRDDVSFFLQWSRCSKACSTFPPESLKSFIFTVFSADLLRGVAGRGARPRGWRCIHFGHGYFMSRWTLVTCYIVDFFPTYRHFSLERFSAELHSLTSQTEYYHLGHELEFQARIWTKSFEYPLNRMLFLLHSFQIDRILRKISLRHREHVLRTGWARLIHT